MTALASRTGLPTTTAVVAAALLLVSPIAAQEEPRATFEEAVAVELVNVEVWVTDPDERPVTGLAPTDFEILHDGQSVPISHFSEVREGVTIEWSLEAPPGGDDASPGGEAPQPVRSAAPESHLILYFDQMRTHPSSTKSLLRDVEQFLATGAVAAEQVLVLRQARGLFVEAPFGSSRGEIEAALARVARTGAEGLSSASDRDFVLDAVRQVWEESEAAAGSVSDLQASLPESSGPGASSAASPRATLGSGLGALGPDPCEIFLSRAESILASWSREQGQRVAVTLGHLSATASYLAGLPGVKTLLYVSDGLSTRPGEALASYVTRLCPAKRADLLSRDLSEELSRSFLSLTRHANSNRVTIHAIQASGLRGSSTRGASSRGVAGQLRQPGLASSFETAERSSERAGMSVLAEETGGRAVFNRGELLSELERIGEEMASYYSLAYRPPDRGRGTEHRIEVRVESPSLEVRHRRGFVEKDVERWMSERLDGVLNLGLASNPLGLRLGAGEIRAASSETELVLPLHVMVPVESLAFLRGEESGEEEKRTARLELRILARDHDTGKLVAEERSFHVRRPPGDGAGLVDLAVELTLARGTHTVAIGLRDAASGEASFVASTLELQE